MVVCTSYFLAPYQSATVIKWTTQKNYPNGLIVQLARINISPHISIRTLYVVEGVLLPESFIWWLLLEVISTDIKRSVCRVMYIHKK